MRAGGNKPARRRLQRLVRWKMWHQNSVELRSAALTGIQYFRYVTSPVPGKGE